MTRFEEKAMWWVESRPAGRSPLQGFSASPYRLNLYVGADHLSNHDRSFVPSPSPYCRFPNKHCSEPPRPEVPQTACSCFSCCTYGGCCWVHKFAWFPISLTYHHQHQAPPKVPMSFQIFFSLFGSQHWYVSGILMVQKTWSPLLLCKRIRKVKFTRISYSSRQIAPFNKLIKTLWPIFICVKTDEVIKFGPPGFRRPPI